MSAVEQDAFLSRDGFGAQLRDRASRGAAVTLGGQWIRLALQIGSTVVLARILTPADYGLVGMVTAVTALAERFKDLGLSAATVQRAELNQRQVSGLFWINVAFGVVLAAAIAAAAPLVARFYDRPELVAITLGLAVSFVFGGLAVQHEALLQRQMRFSALSGLEVGSMAIGVSAALAAALVGAGYWSLVVLHVAMAAGRAAIAWTVCGWRPGPPARLAGVGSMMSFGAGLSVSNLLNYFARSFDNVLIGRYVGAAPLGLYAKAYQLLLLPLQQINAPITNVAIPTLSFLQDEPARFRSYYRSAISGIAYVSMPLIALMAVLSEEIILIVLGPQWVGAAPIFRVLAFAGIAQAIANANGWLYIATGRTGRMALWHLISRPIIVLSFVAGLPWGAYGVAVSYTVVGYLLLVPAFVLAVRGTALSVADIVAAAWRPVALSGLVYVTGARLATAVSGWSAPGTIAAVTTAAALTFSAAVLLWPQARADVAVVVGVARSAIVGRRRRAERQESPNR